MNKQGNVFGSVGKQFGGIAKHVAKRVVREPMEVLKTAVGVQDQVKTGEENQELQALEQAVVGQQNNQQQSGVKQGDDVGGGFATREDFEKYTERSGNKDELELRMARRELEQEWGVGGGLEAGMERVRQEREQKEEQKEQVEEQEKQQEEAMKYEKEKVENAQVKAAKDGASAEKRGKMG